MAVLSNHEICVLQKDPRTGCIPAGVEWMFKWRGAKDVIFSDFQERFNLESQGIEGNSFYSVSRAVSSAYPDFKFQDRPFSTGKEKFAFVEGLIAKDQPCLLSLTKSPAGTCHIVPLVEIDHDIVKVLWLNDEDIEKQTISFQRCRLEYIHDNWPGGKDILFFASMAG